MPNLPGRHNPFIRMITCSVCGTVNDDLSIVCTSCKGFLQGRVDALDLFATVWGLIESPRATLKRIVLARHKNFSVFLSSVFGICLIFDIAWYKNLASIFPSLLTLVGIAIVLGPIVGVFIIFLASMILRRVTNALGGKASRKNLFAVLAYATMPMALSLVFIIPLEIAIFGIDFFGSNPPPMIIKPLEYVLLIGLKSVAVLYALYLFIEATMAANAFERKKVAAVAFSAVSLVTICVLAVHFMKV